MERAQIGRLYIQEVAPPLPEHAAGRAARGAAATTKERKKKKLKWLKTERDLRRARNLKRQGCRDRGESASSNSNTSLYYTGMEEYEVEESGDGDVAGSSEVSSAVQTPRDASTGAGPSVRAGTPGSSTTAVGGAWDPAEGTSRRSVNPPGTAMRERAPPSISTPGEGGPGMQTTAAVGARAPDRSALLPAVEQRLPTLPPLVPRRRVAKRSVAFVFSSCVFAVTLETGFPGPLAGF